ncbi:lipopolysaccharide heptosyltransferase II [Helicobacter jaachi]|uniref:lipopolysaccharide heptosyltransferase II n=2 Tax=Helicobacter jaachi TaxID=1677920 RepID=A0A4U8T9V9_9HELI|nr:lipopolysaccharide heptosyltransferase II [Helicobacter jaachi]
MVSAAFEWLKKSFDKADFTLVGTKASCGIYERDTRVRAIFIDESKTSRFRILAIKKLAKNIGTHDIAISFSNTFFSALLLYLSRSKIRIGYARNARSFLLTNALPLKKYNSSGKKYHQVLLYLALIAPLKAVQTYIFKSLQTPSLKMPNHKHLHTESSNTQSTLLDLLSNQPLKLISTKPILDTRTYAIGINPGAAFGSAKRWEQSHFISIIEYFLSQRYEVYLFGSSIESRANTDIAAALKNHPYMQYFHNLTDKTNLHELVDYISAMSVFITNDSGPMHIATALKVPIVAIFGPTDMYETAPYTPFTESIRQDSTNVLCANPPFVLLSKALPCSPCKKRECPLGHHNCMKFITPAEVITYTNRLLENQHKRLTYDT